MFCDDSELGRVVRILVRFLGSRVLFFFRDVCFRE